MSDSEGPRVDIHFAATPAVVEAMGPEEAMKEHLLFATSNAELKFREQSKRLLGGEGSSTPPPREDEDEDEGTKVDRELVVLIAIGTATFILGVALGYLLSK